MVYDWTLDTLVYDLPGRPPDQVSVQCIWGSSAHDVWATATSDIAPGELWHYDGRAWHPVHNWPYVGFDSGGTYGNDVYAVTGFDSANIFLFGVHGYDTIGYPIVLKWNRRSWSSVPWEGGQVLRGGLGWGVKQGNNKLWAVSARGRVIKYENGLLSAEPQFTDYRLGIYQIAALDNGIVYVNAYKDSLNGDTLMGSVSNLYMRDITAQWSLIERKFVAGAYEDGNGLGRSIVSIDNRLFTANRGLWEKTGTTWIKRLQIDALGGECLVTENDMWIYFKHELWHFNGKEWIRVDIPLLNQYSGYALYGEGWSDGKEIFIPLNTLYISFILHGRKERE
ncbi:MAG: hypothetical protein HYR76_06715 [Ignavibacteria bacterium]|nr:hypothetical protein [Ignavibacteria bacterium]